MYSLKALGSMYHNKARFYAYDQALRKVIGPDSTVLDIGAGTGIFSLLACKYGAKQVHAVEPDESILVAEEIAQANQFGDRIKFYQGFSTDLILDDPVDVIISDLSGVLPYFNPNIPSVIDARERLLAPGGVLISKEDQIRGVIVESPESYDAISSPFAADVAGLDMRAGRSYVFNSWDNLNRRKIRPLSDAVTLATLRYETVEDANMLSRVDWVVTSGGIGHGLVLWFDRVVYPGLLFSNAPDAPKSIDTSAVYGRAFFPWEEAVSLNEGDEVSMEVRADLFDGLYFWSWATRIDRSGEGQSKSFKQSSFLSVPIHLPSLQKKRPDFVATLNDDASVDLMVLELMFAKNSVDKITQELMQKHPDKYGTWREAMTKVSELMARYSI